MSGLYLTLALMFTVFPVIHIGAKVYQKCKWNWIFVANMSIAASVFYGLLLNSCQ